jgi:ankyrin repeat protein
VRIEGSDALYRVLDLDNIEVLKLLLAHGGNANEPATSKPTSDFGCPQLWAIRRRRSIAHIGMLLRAGADPIAKTPAGVSAYRLALQYGPSEIADWLIEAGSSEPLADEELFIAA